MPIGGAIHRVAGDRRRRARSVENAVAGDVVDDVVLRGRTATHENAAGAAVDRVADAGRRIEFDRVARGADLAVDEIVGDLRGMRLDAGVAVAEHAVAGDRAGGGRGIAGVVVAVDAVALVGVDQRVLDQAAGVVVDAVAGAAIQAGLLVIGAAVDRRGARAPE